MQQHGPGAVLDGDDAIDIAAESLSITAASLGIVTELKSRIGAEVHNRVLSYLPLAHVFERAWVECGSLVDGNTHLYFAESLDTFLQDLNRARPTTFISVPPPV